MIRVSCLLPLLALVAGCGGAGDEGPVTVSVIGEEARLVDPNRGPLSPAPAVLMGAVAQGLLAFDAAGQVEPGLAERWIVSDEGRSFIFRLPLPVEGGPALDAHEVARRLRATLGPRSRNPLKPLFGAVDEVIAVTPQVVDMRLSTPRPELLQLLAQPELGLLRRGRGAGPFGLEREGGGFVRLAPMRRGEEDREEDPHAGTILLRAEGAGRAVARFAEGDTELVLGGTAMDLPLARAAAQRGRALRLDPVSGLFGLGFTPADGFFGDPAVREALSMALDRRALAAAMGLPDGRSRETILPAEGAGVPPGPLPTWAGLAPAERRARAAAVVAEWVRRNGAPPPALIALPDGPARRLLLNRLALDWQPIGVFPILARPGERTALRLIDEVAPADAPAWYLLRFACVRRVPCTADADRALRAAEQAPSVAERIVLLREAERLIGQTVPYIPFGDPVRWSLVAPRLTGFRPSPRGHHPLDQLVAPRR